MDQQMPARPGLFITGTDTGVGKTWATARLLVALRAAGRDVVPMKPVQTGARIRADIARPPDLEFLLASAGLRPTARERAWMCPYAFAPACSPHLAARLAGRPIRLARIRQGYDALRRRHEGILVEGAGGVLAPIGPRQTMLDLMRELALPVALVARPGLGTLNHTLLSLRALRDTGLRVAALILAETAPCGRGVIEHDNERTLRRMGGVEIILHALFLPPARDATALREQLAQQAARWAPALRALFGPPTC